MNPPRPSMDELARELEDREVVRAKRLRNKRRSEFERIVADSFDESTQTTYDKLTPQWQGYLLRTVKTVLRVYRAKEASQ